MDITRNWRLKGARSEILATRCPVTGEVLIPQSTPSNTRDQQEVYVFAPLDTEIKPATDPMRDLNFTPNRLERAAAR